MHEVDRIEGQQGTLKNTKEFRKYLYFVSTHSFFNINMNDDDKKNKNNNLFSLLVTGVKKAVYLNSKVVLIILEKKKTFAQQT